MLSPTNQHSSLSTTETLYTSVLRKIQHWVRREILAEDPYDDAALLESALLAEFVKQEQMPAHFQSPYPDQFDPEYQEISSLLSKNLHNPGCL